MPTRSALLALFRNASDIDHILILGMGTGRTAGSVIHALTVALIAVPILLESSYELPACVGSRSLVIALSGSGNTDEVNHAAAAAAERGARLVVVTVGGWLADFAGDHGAAIVRIPREIQPARATLGVMVGGLIVDFRSALGCCRKPHSGSTAPARSCADGATNFKPSATSPHNLPRISSGGTRSARATRLLASRRQAAGKPNSTKPPGSQLRYRANPTPATMKSSPGTCVTLPWVNRSFCSGIPYQNDRVSRLMDLWAQYLGRENRGSYGSRRRKHAMCSPAGSHHDRRLHRSVTSPRAKSVDPNDVPYISQTVKHGSTPPPRSHAVDNSFHIWEGSTPEPSMRPASNQSAYGSGTALRSFLSNKSRSSGVIDTVPAPRLALVHQSMGTSLEVPSLPREATPPHPCAWRQTWRCRRCVQRRSP